MLPSTAVVVATRGVSSGSPSNVRPLSYNMWTVVVQSKRNVSRDLLGIKKTFMVCSQETVCSCSKSMTCKYTLGLAFP